MKKLAILFTGAAALALSACGGADDTTADAPDVTVVEDGEPVPVVTETTVAEDGADSVSVDANGVKVDVQDGDTRVKAGEDGASVTVDN